ncbi:MAG: HigA family addiction module antitoxin [Pseudomonadota bacterium]
MSKSSTTIEDPAFDGLPAIHPGQILAEEIETLGLSATALARALDVTPTRISEIVRERRGISAETALRLARFFGTTPRFWMNLQASYDTKIAYQSHRDSIAQIRPAEPLLQS